MDVYKLHLIRLYTITIDGHSKQTNGTLYLLKNNSIILTLYTVELPWRNNERSISHIPKGTYKVVHRHSKKYNHHLHVLDVPNRELILFHVGNTYRDTRGCILVGKHEHKFKNILGVSQSKKAMSNLMNLCPNNIELTIVYRNN